MTQTLDLIRHGPTHAKTMVGWSDLPADLSDTAALHRLAAYLPTQAVVRSSDLCRARDTADAIAGQRQRLPDDARLREIHFGDWELQRFDQIEASDPERIRAFWEEPGDVRAPGGESWNAMCARADAGVDAMLAAHPGRDLVIVAHFGMILSQIQRRLEIPAEEAFGHRIDNLSVTRMRLDGGVWTVEQINHIP